MTATRPSKPGKLPAVASGMAHVGAILLALLVSFTTLRAQQVQATLSSDTTPIGRPVQLTVKVIGARGAQLPQRLNIEGLDVTLSGSGEQFEINNFKTSFSATYTYMVVPMKAGDFTIPAISFSVGGKTLQTPPVSLQVTSSNTATPRQQGLPAPSVQSSQAPQAPNPSAGPAPSAPPADKIAFAELIVPQKSAYVGEIVPVELRFYFDTQNQVHLNGPPTFGGDGFTSVPLSKFTQHEQQIGNRVFAVATFQTAITPMKTGTLEIPAATLEALVNVPSRNGDIFGLFGGLGEEQKLTVATSPAKIEAKALPQEGKPDEFGGAVGQFSIQATASPKKAGPGDPISLKVTVSGRGNFEAMAPPVLIEADNWRTYPPNEKFQPSPSDPIGYNGQKQYEYMIMARQDQTKTPVAEFSYFDPSPSIQKYVTLKSPAIPVDAKGGGVANTAAAASTAPAAPPPPTPTATPASPLSTPSPEDSLAAQLTPGSFQPFVFNRAFLITNGAIGVIWLGALLVGFSRAVSASAYARQSVAHRERRKLLDRMDNTDIDTRQFLSLGAEFVRARLEAPGAITHLREALENAPVQSETKTAVASILDRADELNYAAGSAEAKLGPEERRQIVTSLKEFDNELQNAR